MRFILALTWCLIWATSNAETHGEAPLCPPGYTGTNCQNPICYTNLNSPKHDGTANYGDLVSYDFSSDCTGSFQFYVDTTMNDVHVNTETFTSNVYANLIVKDPNDVELESSATIIESESAMVISFTGVRSQSGTGIYTVILKALEKTQCTISVFAPTALSADGGFVTDPRDDHTYTFDPQDNNAIARYPQMFVPSYFAFSVNNEKFPIVARNVFIDLGPTITEFNVVPRYGCSTPHLTATAFNCTHFGNYFVTLQGTDSGGNMWQRMYPFECNAAQQTTAAPVTGPTVAPPSTSMKPQQSCENGGVLNQGVCYCGEYFEGAQCEFPVCLNDGFVNFVNEQCVCAPGWSGAHCQHVQCKTKSDDNFDNSHRALSFVVRSAQSMQAQMDQILASANAINDYYANVDPGYFSSYVLSVVQNEGVLFTHEYDDFQSFLSSLESIVHPPVDTQCSDTLLAAISEVVATTTFKQYANSPIFVFSDGTSSDDVNTQGYLIEQLSYYRGQIYFMLSDSASGRCNIDQSSTGFLLLGFFAQFSQGLVIKTDLTQLSQTVKSLSMTLDRTTTLISNDLQDCRKAPAYQPFFVDETMMGGFYVTATGVNLNLSLTLPDESIVSPSLVYQNGNFYMWSMTNTLLGAYMLSMNSPSSMMTTCQYRVVSTSAYEMYYGVSSDMLTDISAKQPVAGQDSHLVARVNNIFMLDPNDVTAEVTVWYNDPQTNGRTVLYASSGLYRDGCLYELYFGSFQCQLSAQILYISVYITDGVGYPVLRTSATYCTASMPNPPDAQCLNGGASYNGTCVCPSHFSGAKCQNILCENQGTPTFGACTCPPGYTGSFCEIIACLDSNPFFQVDFNHKSLSFLVHDSLTTRSTLRTLSQMAPRVVTDILKQHPNWLSNYMLVRFNDSASTVVTNSNSPQRFVQGLQNLYGSNTLFSDFSCGNLDIYPTLLTAITDPSTSFEGIVYIYLYGTAQFDFVSYHTILTHIEDSKIQINVVQAALNPCNEDITSDGLMGLAQFSGGTYVTASATYAGNVMQLLPSQFSSGLVYENTVQNCHDQTFYVPVDAETQSISVYLQGDLNVAPVYTAPDGSSSLGEVQNMWSDLGLGSRMDQLIKPCDYGWIPKDGHCWRFQFSQMQWEDAEAACKRQNATLGTVYSSADQQYLDTTANKVPFWIGLNNIDNIGDWVWAEAGNQSISLTSTIYSNWAAGQPVKDSERRCVMSTKNGWTVTDCSTSAYSVCIKNVYSSDFEPSDLGQNKIARGIWKVNVKADGPCSISVRAQSSLQVFTSFVTDVHSDLGRVEPIADTNSNRLIAHIAGLLDGTVHGMDYAHYYLDNVTIVQAQNVMYRQQCSYNYISTPFHCPDTTFQMMVTGTDSYGFLYQRVIPVACFAGVDKDSCENGAAYYQGQCVCAPGYFGTHCEYIICQNRGIPTGALDICLCASGWTGQFCSIPVCTRGGAGSAPTSLQNKTLVVVLDGSNNPPMDTVNKNIGTTLTTLVKNVNNRFPSWIQNYVAVVFRDSKSGAIPQLSKTIKGTDYNAWAQAVQTEVTNNPYTSTQSSRAIFGALAQALSDPSVQDGSFAFVVTAGNAEDLNNEDLVWQAVSNVHSMIDVLVIGDKTAPGNSNYSDPSVRDLAEMAHGTGGTVYQLAAPTALPVNWPMILNSLHYSYSIIAHHVKNCTDYQDYIQLGQNGSDVIVDLWAQQAPAVAVKDADGKAVVAIPLVTSQTNVMSTFSQNGERAGVWTVNLGDHSQGVCMFQIRAQSNIQVVLAFSQDVGSDNGVHSDNSQPYPVANNQQNSIFANINAGGQLTYAQIFDAEESSLLWASPLLRRSQCTYNYVSQRTFACNRPTFLVAIDGLDHVGHPFRRLFNIHCNGYIPTRPPPPTGPTTTAATTTTTTPPKFCDPSVPKVDLMIAFDSSSLIHEDVYEEIVKSFRPLGNQVTFNKTRIMMGNYDNQQYFTGQTLNSITDVTSFVLRLTQVQNEPTGNSGNNIDDVLKYILNNTETNSPLRSDARKILLFISSIGWDKGNLYKGHTYGFEDPGYDLASLKQQGVEFIPVAFGNYANIGQLSLFSSSKKCLQQIESSDQMVGVVDFLINNICMSTKQC